MDDVYQFVNCPNSSSNNNWGTIPKRPSVSSSDFGVSRTGLNGRPKNKCKSNK